MTGKGQKYNYNRRQEKSSQKCSVTLKPSLDCKILALILARRQVLRIHRQLPEITSKSV